MTARPTSTLAAAVRASAVATAAARLGRGARRSPPLAPVTEPVGSGTVTVLVPARDEASRIGPCIASLIDQGAEVLVVDDGSTDDTRAVAESAGARVVEAGPLPDGWAGKAHALQRGLEIAPTPVVVAVDADTRAQPGFVGAAVAALADAAVVTGGTRVVADSAGERWLHPAMLTTLLYRLGPPGVRTHPGLAMANGQCMVLDRQAVLDAGGFAPVAGSLTEDIALVRHLATTGHRVGFVDATRVLDVAGYGSARAAWDGWGRSLSLAEVTPPTRLVADLAVVWFALALPLPRVLAGRGDAIDVAALALRLGALAATTTAYRPVGVPYLLSPLADPLAALRLTMGALRPSRRWRGRTY